MSHRGNNKKRRQERTRSAINTLPAERISLGDDAKHALRDLSLINQPGEPQQWTKDQDNFSIASLQQHPQSKTRTHARCSTPTLGVERRGNQRKQIVPSSLDITTNGQQRIHSGPQMHNFVGGKQLQLLNEVVFRRTAACFNRSFRPPRTPSRPRQQNSQQRLDEHLQLSCQTGCSSISPMRLQPEVERVMAWRRETLVSNKANVVRKMLKQQRRSNFNESLFCRETDRPRN